MKSFNEYYDIFRKEEQDWLLNQKEEWWRKYENPNKNYGQDSLETLGEYIETTKMLTKHEKNDVSTISNHTNLKNSEWTILFSMLGQALVDWCNENGHSDIWSFSFRIIREKNGLDDVLSLEHWVKVHDGEYSSQEELLKFAPCSEALCDLAYEFLSKNWRNLPLDWNRFDFGLDCLSDSCSYGQWCPCSDGSLSFGCKTENDYVEYVVEM